MPSNVIQEYLVGLGFSVDHAGLRKFEDSIKRAGANVEKFTKNMTVDFLKVGGAVTAAFTALGAGTVALMGNVAQADLGYQLFARRMFMGVDAAKKMKIAQDALGYSLEEIIWGPPELAERYRQLVKDQTVMMKELGGPDFEKKMRNLRDIRFEFTRMGVEIQYFGMRLTESIMDKLFGGPASLEQKLDKLNNWFQLNIPRIADMLANQIAPAMKAIGNLAERIFTQKNVEWAVNLVLRGGKRIEMLIDWLESNNKLGLLFGDTGEAIGKWGSSILNAFPNPSTPQGKQWWSGKTPRSALQDKIAAIANKFGIPPEAAWAVAMKESGMNPNAPMGKAGEIGMFQVLPQTGMAEGFEDLSNLDENILAGLTRLQQGIRKYGMTPEAFAYYNGSGPMARAYGADVWKRYQSFLGPTGGATVQPQSYHSDMGGVTININSPNATPEQIKKAVKDGIDEHTRTTASRMFATTQGSAA